MGLVKFWVDYLAQTIVEKDTLNFQMCLPEQDELTVSYILRAQQSCLRCYSCLDKKKVVWSLSQVSRLKAMEKIGFCESFQKDYGKLGNSCYTCGTTHR